MLISSVLSIGKDPFLIWLFFFYQFEQFVIIDWFTFWSFHTIRIPIQFCFKSSLLLCSWCLLCPASSDWCVINLLLSPLSNSCVNAILGLNYSFLVQLIGDIIWLYVALIWIEMFFGLYMHTWYIHWSLDYWFEFLVD